MLFLWRRGKSEKEKEENSWRRRISFSRRRIKHRRKRRNILGEGKHLFCGVEDKRRRKRRNIFGERRYLFVEEKKNGEGKKRKYLEMEHLSFRVGGIYWEKEICNQVVLKWSVVFRLNIARIVNAVQVTDCKSPLLYIIIKVSQFVPRLSH